MEETGAEEEEVSNYWMALRKISDTGIWKWYSRSQSHGELVVEVGVDLSQDRPRNECVCVCTKCVAAAEYLYR